MIKRLSLLWAVTAMAQLLSACRPAPVSQDLVAEIRTAFAARSAETTTSATNTIIGSENWFFYAPELRHVSVGKFWDDRSHQPGVDEPLSVILDFHQQLRNLDVELLLVPVPPKSLIFPDKVGLNETHIPTPVPRLDPAHAKFYELLRQRGVSVLDLTERFLRERFHPENPLYCRHDTRWSGAGCVIAAQQIAEIIKTRSWYSSVENVQYISQWSSTSITGNLVQHLDPPVSTEEIRLRLVASDANQNPRLATVSASSPVVLIGDSHSLIYHSGGDMHAANGGLADQLAFELSLPVDLVAVRDSPATSARIALQERTQENPTYWSGKQIVVWCFAAHEFTEADEWRRVTVAP
ncbi:MAG: hypothetical protein VX262_01090 [Acidobacteriota bacterium]|nr:hypothetical protein [Acidobacteriota bacterium]